MDKYKIAVDMLIETIEFLMDGLENAEIHPDDKERTQCDIKNVKKRIQVVRKFEK